MGLRAIDPVERALEPAEPVAALKPGAEFDFLSAGTKRFAFERELGQPALQHGDFGIRRRHHYVVPALSGFLFESITQLPVAVHEERALHIAHVGFYRGRFRRSLDSAWLGKAAY